MALILKKASQFATEPLDVGEGKLSLVDVISQTESAPFSGGIAEIWDGAPVEFEYDDDAAVCFMLEGEIDLTEGDSTHRFEPGDIVFIPQQAGLVVSWSTASYGKFAYVTYPHWR
ncbi:MAG: cupin domain-containing protein [Terrimesophilobacter sp.]